MKNKKKSVILFPSTNYTLWAAEELRKHGIECEMISIPRHLSSDCGYCLQIAAKDKLIIEKVLTEKHIDFDKIVEL